MADGDLYLSDSPNVDTGLVEQGGQLHRSVLTAVPEGTLSLSDSANVSTGYVTDSNGKKHKVNLVSSVEGTLELSDNPSADTGYVTDNDGKKHKVKLTATLHGGGGSTPVIEELNVTPSTSAQTITAPSGKDGYSPVNVSAVTSSIDANIVAGNIKKDVSILGVTGSYEGVAPASYRAFTVDTSGKLVNSTTTPWVPLPAGTKTLSAYAFYEAYQSTPANVLSGVIDLSSLTNLDSANSMYNCFYGCPGITSVKLSSLFSLVGNNTMSNCFYGCIGITSIDLPSLTYITSNSCQYMFYGCTGATSIDLPSLTEVSGGNAMLYCFFNCTGVTSVDLPSLTTINGNHAMQYCFGGCTSLTKLSFYALTPSSFGTRTNQFNYMLLNCSNVTVHFPIAIQSTIGSWADVTAGFGGTNTTVLFDIVTSLTGADSNTYARKQKESTSTATAWTYNNTLYYTSGTAEPVVGGTIYSDSACTTAVTTISAIA